MAQRGEFIGSDGDSGICQSPIRWGTVQTFRSASVATAKQLGKEALKSNADKLVDSDASVDLPPATVLTRQRSECFEGGWLWVKSQAKDGFKRYRRLLKESRAQRPTNECPCSDVLKALPSSTAPQVPTCRTNMRCGSLIQQRGLGFFGRLTTRMCASLVRP
eukprot:1572536-Amphidinium_carterae.1